MTEPDKGAWSEHGGIQGFLQSMKIRPTQRTQTRENVVQLQPNYLTHLHDTARRALSALVAIHAEIHAIAIREEEAQEALRAAQQAVIEAVSEIGIRGEIVEPSNGG